MRAVLGETPRKVADVETRIALTAQVKVDEVEAPTIAEHLVWVKIPMYAAGRGLGGRGAVPLRGVEESLEAFSLLWLGLC